MFWGLFRQTVTDSSFWGRPVWSLLNTIAGPSGAPVVALKVTLPDRPSAMARFAASNRLRRLDGARIGWATQYRTATLCDRWPHCPDANGLRGSSRPCAGMATRLTANATNPRRASLETVPRSTVPSLPCRLPGARAIAAASVGSSRKTGGRGYRQERSDRNGPPGRWTFSPRKPPAPPRGPAGRPRAPRPAPPCSASRTGPRPAPRPPRPSRSPTSWPRRGAGPTAATGRASGSSPRTRGTERDRRCRSTARAPPSRASTGTGTAAARGVTASGVRGRARPPGTRRAPLPPAARRAPDGCVVQRRVVRPPQDRGEQDPARDRRRHGPGQAAVEGGNDHGAPDLPGGRLEGQDAGRPQHEQRRRDHGEREVLRHVDRQQQMGVVVHRPLHD